MSGEIYAFERELANDTRHWERDGFALRLLPFQVDETNQVIVERPEVQAVFPPGTIQRVSLSEPFAVAATPGLSGSLIVEESGQVLGRTLEVTGIYGKFGVNFKEVDGLHATWRSPGDQYLTKMVDSFYRERPSSSSAVGEISSMRFIEMVQDQIFRRYAAYKTAQSKNVFLSWHDFKSDEHFIAVPISFDIGRAPRTFGAFSFSLLLVDYYQHIKRASRRRQDNVFDRISRGISTIAEVVTGAVKIAQDLINGIRDIVNTVRGWAVRLTAAVRSITQIVDTASNLLRTIDATVAETLAIPASLANAFKRSVDSLRSATNSLSSGTYRKAVLDAQTRELDRIAETLVLLSNVNQTSAPSRLVSSTSTARLTSSTSVRSPTSQATVRAGESFYAFVERVRAELPGSSHANVALRIIELNGLRAPYVSLVGAPGTIRPGQAIIVPGTNTQEGPGLNAGVLPVPRSAPIEERMYGRDLRLLPNAEGLLDISLHEGGDITTHAGVDCFLHSVVTRLSTTEGDSLLYPELGLNVSVGSANTPASRRLLEVDAQTELLSDPWIPTIQGLTSEISGDKVTLTVTVSPDIPSVQVTI